MGLGEERNDVATSEFLDRLFEALGHHALEVVAHLLFKQRGAVLAPPIRARYPLRSAGDLFRSKWFAVGWVVSLAASGLHVGALSVAPLSTVQAVLSGGLVFLAVLAERWFGFHLGARQWMGLTITASGLVIIGLTGTGQSAHHYSLAALIAVESFVLALGAGLVWISSHRSVAQRGAALLLATAAGVLFGVSDVAIKYLSHAPGAALGLLSPWTLTAGDLVRNLVLRLCPQPADRSRGRGDRDHLSSQPCRNHRRDTRVRRVNRFWRARCHRAGARVLPRHRWRRAHARAPTRHLHGTASRKPPGQLGAGRRDR
jgi:hypothetical protein